MEDVWTASRHRDPLPMPKVTYDPSAAVIIADGILEAIIIMATTVERVEQVLSLVREADFPTLLALDRELHLLLEQRVGEMERGRQGPTVREEFRERYPHIAVDPDLFALVGVQPENPLEDDKPLIREQICRRLT